MNRAESGTTVALKFRLFAGDEEITDPTRITFRAVTMHCTAAGEPIGDVDVFTTTGSTSLRYNASAKQFVQNWQSGRAHDPLLSVAEPCAEAAGLNVAPRMLGGAPSSVQV